MVCPVDYAHIDRENSLVLSLNCHDSFCKQRLCNLLDKYRINRLLKILAKAGVTFRCFSTKQMNKRKLKYSEINLSCLLLPFSPEITSINSSLFLAWKAETLWSNWIGSSGASLLLPEYFHDIQTHTNLLTTDLVNPIAATSNSSLFARDGQAFFSCFWKYEG